jgi:hypothetical protein
MEVRELSNAGTLYTYSIVCRSFPGIEVPYISAVVDLDGGGTIKGNLIGVELGPWFQSVWSVVPVRVKRTPRPSR